MRIGGVPSTDLRSDQLYRRVGFVFQDPYLMRMSVRDNIRLAHPEATDADVVRAARAAQIHERITHLPRGYDSVVGEDAQLSGGEQQRLAIARSILLDAPILVLMRPPLLRIRLRGRDPAGHYRAGGRAHASSYRTPAPHDHRR